MIHNDDICFPHTACRIFDKKHTIRPVHDKNKGEKNKRKNTNIGLKKNKWRL
jgi:hypothetical protein